MTPRAPSPEERDAARMLLAEVAGSGLAVALAPAPRPRFPGHCIRVVVDRNPDWYRRLAAQLTSRRRRARRRHDTDLRRRHLVRALERAAAGEPYRFPYDELLQPVLAAAAAAEMRA